MPFQPYSGSSKSADFGSMFGQGLGQGLGEQISNNLNQLAQQKMMRMQQVQTAQGFEPIFGKEGASTLSRLTPDERKILLQNPGAIQQLLGLGNQQSSIQGMPQNTQQFGLGALQNLQPDQERNSELQKMAAQAGITPDQIAQVLNPFGRKPSIQEQEQLALQGKIAEAAQQQPNAQQQGISQQDQTARAQQIADAFTPEPIKQAREKLALQRYQTFQPKFNQIEQEGKIARGVKHTATEALNLLKTRLARTGISGALTPKYLQTPEGQELQSLLGKLVLQNASLSKGVPSLGKLRMEEGAKASIWQHPKTIENILERTIEDPEINRDVTRDDARESLLQQFGSNIPNDIIPRIEARSRELLKESKTQQEQQFTKQSLEQEHPASKVKEGDKARNPITGQVAFIVRNGRWEDFNG